MENMAPGWQVVQVLALGMTLVCGMLPAQSRRIEDLAAGRLLVMEPRDADPVFAESVILLIHYDTDGVVGLRLNQPSRVPLSRLQELNGTAKRSDPAYIGGPVRIEEVTALVRAPSAPRDAAHVTADVYAVQSKSGLEAALKASTGPADLRVYLGYCGWVIPQLKNEVTRGSWYIFDHGERFAFDSAPGTVWKRLIELTNVRLALRPVLNFQPVNPVPHATAQ
jgi:putative transcriptional regulator